jgi:hypothetical protein
MKGQNEVDCRLWIKKRDSVVGNVRLEWTIDEFFSNGGDTVFADKMATSLGIHPSRIKVVGVVAGSISLDYQIEPDQAVVEAAD